MDRNRQRIYAALIFTGAGILFARAGIMLAQGFLGILIWWVSALLVLEFLVDLSCMAAAVPWFVSGDRQRASLALRLGAAAAILHALRVLIYVLGRTAALLDFDQRPEYRGGTATTEWFWPVFAATLSVLGIIGVIVIWRIRRRRITKPHSA